MYSLRTSFCTVPDSVVMGMPRDRATATYSARRIDAVARQLGQELLHVLDRIDGDPDAPHLPLRHRVIGVIPHLGRQVKGDRQSRLSLSEKVPEPAVGLPGVTEPG